MEGPGRGLRPHRTDGNGARHQFSASWINAARIARKNRLLRVQELQDLVEQNAGPNDGFEDSKKAVSK